MNSTTKISTEFREFDNVEELIKTSVLSDYDYKYFWDEQESENLEKLIAQKVMPTEKNFVMQELGINP